MARIEIDYAAYGERCEFSGATVEAAIQSAERVLRGMDWEDSAKITLTRCVNCDDIANQDGETVGYVTDDPSKERTYFFEVWTGRNWQDAHRVSRTCTEAEAEEHAKELLGDYESARWCEQGSRDWDYVNR